MQTYYEIIIGVILAICLILIIKQIRFFSKEKIVFAVGLVITAFIYVIFGLFSDSNTWKIIELCGVLIYAFFAWFGVKKSVWFLVFGWAFHVVWDAGLHGISTPFVPHWYIGFCIGFDLAIAGYLGYKEIKNSL